MGTAVSRTDQLVTSFPFEAASILWSSMPTATTPVASIRIPDEDAGMDDTTSLLVAVTQDQRESHAECESTVSIIDHGQ